MLDTDLILACIKNDKVAQKQLFQTYYGKMAVIANRFSKSNAQGNQVLNEGFTHIFNNLSKFKNQTALSLDEWMTQEFVLFAVQFIRNIRNEYYVASTVRASETTPRSFDLFMDNIVTDFKNVDLDVLVLSLQQLVPSQRLVFNLHIVDAYDLQKVSEILEASEQTVKSNLEKAKYNLQKNIDKNSKSMKNEQFV